jgi:hypothetical protein
MPWTVSPLAQDAGLFLLNQDDWLQKSQDENRKEKERVFAQLGSLKNFKPFASSIKAFTLKGLEPGFSSNHLLQRLLVEEKILIPQSFQTSGTWRELFSSGIEKTFGKRSTVKSPEENGSMIQQHALALTVALVLDFFLGDLERFPHPVRWMGAFYAWWDKFFRKANWQVYETGLFTVLFIGSAFALATWFLLSLISSRLATLFS